MKNLINLIVLLILFALCWTLAPAQTIAGNVVRVLDGDTIDFRALGGKYYRVRLSGIDAPETRQAFGLVCKQQLVNLTSGKSAVLRIEGTDIYKRNIGFLSTNEIANVSAEMIRDGCAWVFMPPPLLAAAYDAWEATARTTHVGLWSDIAPVRPSDFRRYGNTPPPSATCP